MADAKGGKGAVRQFGVETARNGMVYLAGEAASSIVSLAILIFLARALKPAEFGLFAIVIAFNTLLGVGGNFGVGTAFRKRLPQLERSQGGIGTMLASGYAVALLLGFIISLIGVLLSGYIASSVYNQPSIALALKVASATVFFTVLFNLTMAALVGLNRVRESAIANVLYAVSQLAFVVALVLSGYGVNGAIVGVAASFIVASAYELAVLGTTEGITPFAPDPKMMGDVTKFSIPVVVSYIAAIGAENFAILLLGAFASASTVGNYNAAFKIGRFVQIILISNTFILLPAFSKAFSKRDLAGNIDRVYNGSLFYTLLFLMPSVAYLVAVATPLMHLLFSTAYSQAPLYFAFVAIGTMIGIIGSYAGTLIISYGDTKRFMKYQVSAVVIEIGLLVGLTPSFGAIGALLALFVISPIVLDVIYVRALYSQFKFRHKTDRLAGVIIPSIALFAVCGYIATPLMHDSILSIPITLAVAVLLYPALLGFLGGVKRSDTDFIRAISGRHPFGPAVEYALRYVEHFMR